MTLHLKLSDLAHLDKIKKALADNDPKGQFATLGMRQVSITENAVDDLIPAIKREFARVGLEADKKRRLHMVADDVTILRDSKNLKDTVFARLAEHFSPERVTLSDGHAALHADEAVQDRCALACKGSDCIVSVGGGTITDIAKIAAMRNSTPLHIVLQTAASVDGFTDNFSVVLQKGIKRTLLTRWPDVVLTDCRTIAQAPHVLNASGFGELLSMYSAPGDWFLAAKCGMDDTFTPVLVELLGLCGDGVEKWAGAVGKGEVEGIGRLAAALAMRGIVTGVGGTTASLSGMEHLISHMLDIHGAESGAPTGLHGAQVGVASVISAAAFEYFCERMAKNPPDQNQMFGNVDAWETRMKAGFSSIDPTGRLGGQCWTHYRAKLVKWQSNRAAVHTFFQDWSPIRARREALGLDSHAIAACLRQARAPMRYADLQPAVAPELLRWAVTNCQYMRERFTVADLLNFSGWWDEDGVSEVLERAEAACKAAEVLHG